MKLICTSLLLLFSSITFAQQESVLGQFWNNQTHLNPAFAGLEHRLQGGVLYRNQWNGIDGAPVDFYGFYNMRIAQTWGVGTNLDVGSSGSQRTFNVSIPVSYHVKINEKNAIALGASLGFNNFQASDFIPPTAVPDPSIPTTVQEQQLLANLGIAYENNFMTGSFSVRTLELAQLGGTDHYQYQLYFLSMLRFKIPIGSRSSYSNHSLLMVEALHTYQNGFQRMQIDGRVFIKDKFTFFGGYVIQEGPIFGAGWDFFKKLRATYSAQWFRSNLQSDPVSISHEASLVYQIPISE